jgi:hypothetical protein
MTAEPARTQPVRTRGHQLVRGLAVAIVVAYVLAAVAGLWSVLVDAGSGDGVPPGLPSAVADLLLVSVPVVGAVIVSRHPRHVIGWLLLAIAVLIALGNAGGLLLRYQLETPGEPSAVVTLYLWVSSWVFGPTLILSLVLVPLLFPDGRPPSRRWRPVVWAAAVVAILDVMQQGFTDRLVARDWASDGDGREIIYEVANPVAIPGLPVEGPVEAVMGDLLGLIFVTMVVAAWAAPVVRFWRGTGIERQQVKWLALVIGAVAVTIPLSLVADAVLDVPTYMLSQMTFVWGAAIAVAIGLAILRHGLYDIDRIISRTVSYGLVVAVLGAVYVAGVVGLGTAVSAVTGQEGSDVVVAGSVLAVVALFRPVRARVQRAVDRRFNRSGYQARQAVDAFGQQLRDEVDQSRIRSAVTHTVATVVEPRHVSLWIPLDRAGSTPGIHQEGNT